MSHSMGAGYFGLRSRLEDRESLVAPVASLLGLLHGIPHEYHGMEVASRLGIRV